jgi:undecaprenyl-diphosphatase
MGLGVIALILGILEGLTEFIPVSSTGHLIIAGKLLGFEAKFGTEAAKCFEVFIQLAAILAVVVLYRQRFIGLFVGDKQSQGFRGWRGLFLLALTTLPALVAGVGLHDVIKKYFFGTETVALALATGAVGIFLAEWLKPKAKVCDLDSLTWREALIVGLFQCLSLWSGISRSAATIVGGMLVRVDRKTAAEYSFLAAVPIMFAATIYDLYKTWDYLSIRHLPYFVVGFVVSFFAAMIAVKGFIRLLQHWTLKPFAVYRLILAALVLWLVICASKS